MRTDKELPKIDLPTSWIAGNDISTDLLAMYANYPVRLKCEVFALLVEGEMDVILNTTRLHVTSNDFVTLLPGSIFQICSLKDNLKIYFVSFSSEFINSSTNSRSTIDTMLFTLGRPIVSIPQKGMKLTTQYLQFLVDLFEFNNETLLEELALNVYNGLHKGVSILYNGGYSDKTPMTKAEQICRMFAQLVAEHYAETRNVSWYANKLGITHAHLCSVVKSVTGRTCIDIIATMVIMDAKSQLKLTDLPIQAISESLNFANMSFFGKYFKRNVGMSPLEYRNNG